MDYQGLIERNVNHMMDKMFGDKDPALKTITKMNILFDGSDETAKTEMENVLTKIKKLNAFEEKCIKNELYLTYGNDGNIISVNDINESENIVCEESKNESNPDFCPSNR